jgi:hypothetical protein
MQDLIRRKRGHALRRRASLVLFLVILVIRPAWAVQPDPDTVPFTRDWFPMNFPVGGGIGTKLMWEHARAADPKVQADARRRCGEALQKGLSPMFEMAWDDPKAKGPGYDEWTAWKQAHKQYWIQDRDGKPCRDPYYFDAISAAMPYDPADWPAGVKNATRNEWDLAKLVGFAKATGAVGYFAADKYDLGWAHYMTTDKWDFNPRMIDAFAARTGVNVPGATVSERSAFIVKNHFSRWTDFICESIAVRHTQILPALKAQGVEHPMVAFQIDYNVTANRIKGLDLRMVGERSRFGEVVKRVEMQGDPGRPIQDRSLSPSFFGLFACRAPGVMHGGQMASLHADFWRSLELVGFPRGTTDPEKIEFAGKYLKQHWLGVGWWHVANADGSLRRGVCEWMRTYWDSGKVAPEVVELARSVKPTRPFGLAFYYSVSVERAYESEYPATGKLYPLTGGMSANTGGGKAHEAQHFGIPIGYSVSDVALDSLQRANYPTGWLTCGIDRMPPEELAKLRKIAPVYDLDKIADLATIPSPVRFSAGACGYAFRDQKGRSILLVWRQGRGPNAKDERHAGNTAIDCTVSLSGIADGSYVVEDLLDASDKRRVVVSGGRGSFSFRLDRWECRAFRSDLPSPNG